MLICFARITMASGFMACLRHIPGLFGRRSRISQWTSSRSFINSTKTLAPFEPDDMNLPPEIPEYEVLNIRLQGYDYPILETYAKYVHNLTLSMGLDAIAFPVPAKTSKVVTFKPSSTNIQNQYHLAKYERTIQVDDLPSPLASILFDVIHQNLPEGVQLTIKEPDPEEEEFRYVPDIMLQELQDQVLELDKLKEDRRK